MITGSCLCGQITFATEAEPASASMCHCAQCSKQSGGVWASAQVHQDALTITGPVSWFEASAMAKRGFCATCGSSLFWQAHDENQISFALGAVNTPTGITLEKHIFTAEKSDYYTIADSLPQKP
ncbi:GFA family protein [Epibacterium ulvae]|uniref:GFA family protein n=1 Tax=Epibacterium ulvae TaxID=1156985 RepID=UPI001BFC37BF|nr:GFA family protein [Epibacterium ulvae]MBT8153471.1 GFA family protein [Epibacterium ulvae]